MASKLENINEVLKASPELNNYPVEMWQKTHDFFKREGFGSNKFGFMVSQNPKLMVTSEEKIFEALNKWRAFQFGERDTITLIMQYPELLNVQHTNELNRKIDTIKVFVGGGSNIFKLLLNSPGVINESVDSINEKIEYLKSVMRVEPEEVYNSTALSCDIDMLKTRHIFLVRMGLYIQKKKKRDPEEISKNPKLSHITDTSDKRFATKVCHVTLEEFETFEELYRRELDDEDEGELSDEEEYEEIDVKC